MSNKDIKKLVDMAKAKLKEKPTKEEALQSFVSAGIMNAKGEFTAPYAILSKVVKPV
jgi:hypothetical protein